MFLIKIFIVIFVLTNASLILAQEYDWQNNHIRIGECVMLTEQWLPIKGYEGYYVVSNLGNVKSLGRMIIRNNGRPQTFQNRIMTQSVNSCGYLAVTLSKNGIQQTVCIHQLVWEAFGNRASNGHKLQIDHIDGNKLNNHIDNFQLLTNRENTSKGKLLSKKSGLPTGVWHDKYRNKYGARIDVNGITLNLGRFDTIEQASKAYQQKLRIVA